MPTATPTSAPTGIPTTVPTAVPTTVPTAAPTTAPTTTVPTAVPTTVPTAVPTFTPTAMPTLSPRSTAVPTVPTLSPGTTSTPTALPTTTPTTLNPTATAIPTSPPTAIPTSVPTAMPSVAPSTVIPTSAPVTPTFAPIQSCDYNAFDAPRLSNSNCSNNVANGIVCSVSHSSLVCGNTECINGRWLPSKVTCDCSYNSLSSVAGADVHGNGCIAGGVVVDKGGCAYVRNGWSCGSVVCDSGVWNTSQWSGYPTCTPNSCAYDDLVLSVGAGNGLNGCVAGGTVISGGACGISQKGYSCEVVTCIEGRWNTTAPSCTPKSCAFNALAVVAGITAAGNGCNNGGGVTSGNWCSFSRTGYTCSSVACFAGAWNTTGPSCTANDCLFTESRLPIPTSVSQDCRFGDQVRSGATCSFSAHGHVCNETQCTAGEWALPSVCTPLGCSTGDLNLTSGQDTNCERSVFSGATCDVFRTGYTCIPIECTQGTWSTATPTCLPDGCLFSALTADPDAVAEGSGCTANRTVVHGGSCAFIKHGFKCNLAECVTGSWVKTSITCAVDPAAPSGDDGNSLVPIIIVLVILAVCLALVLWALWRVNKQREGMSGLGNAVASPNSYPDGHPAKDIQVYHSLENESQPPLRASEQEFSSSSFKTERVNTPPKREVVQTPLALQPETAMTVPPELASPKWRDEPPNPPPQPFPSTSKYVRRLPTSGSSVSRQSSGAPPLPIQASHYEGKLSSQQHIEI
eukprot:TRINITY_DN1455_c0_g1_i7.p1 TRINITY_DN1455_c0_g1~~TRINITY_DN1455_c0_g1_i7.p1  ORF type:complete len:742 (+),score=89.78 TRINITY_DN1455_c0_g1_i7:1470-3695(+)